MLNSPKPLKVLVTGSTGFVGSLLCEKLVKEGHEVLAQARNPKKFKQFQVPGKLVKGNMNPSGSHTWVEELPEDLDAVVHVAGITHSFDCDDYYQVNAEATKNLILDLKKRYTDLRFILVSSQAATGPSIGNEFRHEDDKPNPISHYGRSKVLAEKYLNDLAPEGWIRSVVRPPLVIGPRDPAILDIFKMVKGRVIFKFGLSRENKNYSFVGVYDLIEVIFKLLNKAFKDDSVQVFHSAFHNPITYDELISEIKTAMNIGRTFNVRVPLMVIKGFSHVIHVVNKIIPLNIRVTTDKVKDLYPISWLASSEKSRDQLNFQYNWGLNKSINTAYDDYKARGWL